MFNIQFEQQRKTWKKCYILTIALLTQPIISYNSHFTRTCCVFLWTLNWKRSKNTNWTKTCLMTLKTISIYYCHRMLLLWLLLIAKTERFFTFNTITIRYYVCMIRIEIVQRLGCTMWNIVKSRKRRSRRRWTWSLASTITHSTNILYTFYTDIYGASHTYCTP